MSEKKVLIVDDEEHVLLVAIEELRGYIVIVNETGDGLLEQIEKEKPDILVLDIRLGKHDGLDLLQDVRNRFYGLPIILYSAYDIFKEDMRSIGADAFVVKSFDLSALKKRISMLLEKR